MTCDEVAVDNWYQLAVIRVYGPWLRKDDLVPGDERVRASGRVGHARLILTIRHVEFSERDAPK
ncbi:hypothetical protein GCM10022254_40470 [Actinomadura meridiana]|uniref:Uncharacterized protein n=1 Tax=Actinomadura meridiana TaxID=559626 RepID=A0ABP8C7N2_9ACTN